jgi:hypothetical protein
MEDCGEVVWRENEVVERMERVGGGEILGQGGATEFFSNRSRYRAWQSHSVSIGHAKV